MLEVQTNVQRLYIFWPDRGGRAHLTANSLETGQVMTLCGLRTRGRRVDMPRLVISKDGRCRHCDRIVSRLGAVEIIGSTWKGD